MKKVVKYLPQLAVFIIEALLIWVLAYDKVKEGNIQELMSVEYFLLIFIFIVLGYGAASVCGPKDDIKTKS